MFKKIAIAATLALVSATALAANPAGFYAGADVVSTSVTDADGSYTGFGGFGGYRINDTFAVEGALRHLGSDGNIKTNQAAVSLVVTGYASGEWDRISLFVRAGVNRLDAGHGCNGNVCGDGGITRALIGVGAGYDFTPRISGRFEYQRPMSDVSSVSLGVVFNF